MRMLHVLESFEPGGIETTFLSVLRTFRTEDPAIQHDVLAFEGGALEQAFREVAHTVRIGCDASTIDAHVSSAYDVAHILVERCAYRLVPELLARSATRVVYGKTYDLGGMYRLNEGLRWQADESMLAACDGATFTTPGLAAGYALPRGRATVLRTAADIARFRAIADVDATTPRRIVCVANLHARKRLGDLVTAFTRVGREIPDAELRFVGGGHEEDVKRLMTLAAHRGLSNRVTFAGQQADVAPEIARARVIALPSSCEGVPTALIEGMAAGRPAVATAVGHVSTIIDDGVEGFLTAPGDVHALADRLTRLLSDPALAARMGQAARRRAAGHDVVGISRTLLGALRPTA